MGEETFVYILGPIQILTYIYPGLSVFQFSSIERYVSLNNKKDYFRKKYFWRGTS